MLPSSNLPPIQVSLEVILECRSDNLLPVLFTLLAYKSIYLWVGLFLAFENRKVNIPALDDSKYIAAAGYCSFVTCIPLVPIGILDLVQRDIRFGIISGGLLFANTIILVLLFIPRVCYKAAHAVGADHFEHVCTLYTTTMVLVWYIKVHTCVEGYW